MQGSSEQWNQGHEVKNPSGASAFLISPEADFCLLLFHILIDNIIQNRWALEKEKVPAINPQLNQKGLSSYLFEW